MKDARGTGIVPKQLRTIFRSGMNFSDRNRARAWMNEGLTVDEVSFRLKVEPACIASFFESWGGLPNVDPLEEELKEYPVKSRPKATKVDVASESS